MKKYLILPLFCFLAFMLSASESADVKRVKQLAANITLKEGQAEADAQSSGTLLANRFEMATNSDKHGIPCSCAFNRNRDWNPETIVWNNEEWQCAYYKIDGSCLKVGKVK